MATQRNLKEELLRQNGIDTKEGEEFRDKVLAIDQANVVRMRRLTIAAWILVGASLVAAGVVRLSYPGIMEFWPAAIPTFIIVWQALLLIAIIFSISLYIRSRTLTMHQIQSSLALIEEHLRKMSQKD